MWEKIKQFFNKKSSPPSGLNLDFFKSFDKNKALLKEIFEDVQDVKFRELEVEARSKNRVRVLLLYVDSLVDKNILNDSLLEPILFQQYAPLDFDTGDPADIFVNRVLKVSEIQKTSRIKTAVDEVLLGKTVVLVGDSRHALISETKGWKERSVPTPAVERTVRGPNVSFMENIGVNIGLLRRIVKSDKLKVEYYTKGRYTKTKIAVVYIKDTANPKIVNEVKKRIETIDVDQIMSCKHVSELIEDNPLSPFSTIYETQRPDVAAAGVLEGRVGVFTDGCPTTLVAPMLFMENFISPEDYYAKFWVTLFSRTLRFIAFLVNVTLPAFYVSIISFHQEVLPMTLVARIYASREGIPFPVVIEMLAVGLFFEAIREAGARVPTTLGASITIVGALILGQTAVTAGLLSADGVIVGGLTGIAIFVIPSPEFTYPLLILRLITVIAAAVAGFYGMTLVILLALMHLASLRSFGVPYLRPLAPLQLSDLKDVFMRVPYILMNTRPRSLETPNVVRQGNEPIKRFFFKYRLVQDED